jgi:hypothetical protein
MMRKDQPSTFHSELFYSVTRNMAMADDGFGNLGTWATEPFIASRVTSGFDDANNPRGSVAADASDALAPCANVRLDTFECYMRTLVRRAAVHGHGCARGRR